MFNALLDNGGGTEKERIYIVSHDCVDNTTLVQVS